MARRKNAKAAPGRAEDIRLLQPDRSAPEGTTLIDLAQSKGLFAEAKRRTRSPSPSSSSSSSSSEDDEEISPAVERILESVLWSLSLAALHSTLDILVRHQYAIRIDWELVCIRSLQAFFSPSPYLTNPAPLTWNLVFTLLFYTLHRHRTSPNILPPSLLPPRLQAPLRQSIFFAMSAACGCNLVYMTNEHGYMAVMKRAPTLGCLWVWAVVELELLGAVGSLLVVGGFLVWGGYSVR